MILVPRLPEEEEEEGEQYELLRGCEEGKKTEEKKERSSTFSVVRGLVVGSHLVLRSWIRTEVLCECAVRRVCGKGNCVCDFLKGQSVISSWISFMD